MLFGSVSHSFGSMTFAVGKLCRGCHAMICWVWKDPSPRACLWMRVYSATVFGLIHSSVLVDLKVGLCPLLQPHISPLDCTNKCVYPALPLVGAKIIFLGKSTRTEHFPISSHFQLRDFVHSMWVFKCLVTLCGFLFSELVRPSPTNSWHPMVGVSQLNSV